MSTVSPATLVPSPGEGSEPPDLEFACPLCCGELPPSKVTTISSCGHQGCNPCFATWIERHEQSGKTSAPECPFCRTPLSDGDVVQVLGRPFAPRDALLKPAPEEEIDELTLAWLHDNTVLCPGCGIRTNKTEGCDHITCLCGYQFCYSCGQAACQCGHRTRLYANEDFDATAMRDEAGIFDYRQTLRRREVRMERDRRRSNVEGEQLLRWRLLRGKPSHDSAAHTCTGSWIFSYPTARKSLTALRGKVQSQLSPEVRLRRGKRYFNLRRDMFLRWNYFRPNRLPVTGSWLFHANKKAGIRCLEREMAVFSQAEHIDREIERRKVSARKIKYSREKERQSSHQREIEPSWLFLKKGEDVRCLHKMCCSNVSCTICHGSEDEQLAQNLASVQFLFG